MPSKKQKKVIQAWAVAPFETGNGGVMSTFYDNGNPHGYFVISPDKQAIEYWKEQYLPKDGKIIEVEITLPNNIKR